MSFRFFIYVTIATIMYWTLWAYSGVSIQDHMVLYIAGSAIVGSLVGAYKALKESEDNETNSK